MVEEFQIPDAATHPARIARDFYGLAMEHHRAMLAESELEVPRGAGHLVCAAVDTGELSGNLNIDGRVETRWRRPMHADEVTHATLNAAWVLVKRVIEVAHETNSELFTRIEAARRKSARWLAVADLTRCRVDIGLVGQDGFDSVASIDNPTGWRA